MSASFLETNLACLAASDTCVQENVAMMNKFLPLSHFKAVHVCFIPNQQSCVPRCF
jgi:hypothetical protein